MKKYIFLLFFSMFSQCYATQCIYPVAHFQDSVQLLLLYQKSLDTIELWIWNNEHHYAIKALSSFLKPANLRILPSGDGFSFIDQGYIKIKEFLKRSPTTLPIYEPISLFSHMNWIDDKTFYFIARQGEFFQIFQGDRQAQIHALTYDAADALYPQYTHEQFFYIKRDTDNQHSIVRQNWQPYKTIEATELIFGPTSEQLCFLHMIDDTQGFYLQAPTHKVKSVQESYEFHGYHLYKIDGVWKSEKLYNFYIPAKFLTGPDRLYESIEPFLPNYTQHGFVYYVSWCQETNEFQLFQYDVTHKSTQELTNHVRNKENNEQLIFAPYIHKDTLHCGIICDKNTATRTLQKVFELDEYVHIDLPTWDIKL